MTKSSPGTSVGDQSSDVEKVSRSSRSIDGNNAPASCPEKGREERRRHEDPTNAEAALGIPVDDSDFLDLDQDNGPDAQASNVLSRVVSRVVSRASVKSNPGPPPDGGLKAWITGKSLSLPV